jgi:hypothetical protein
MKDLKPLDSPGSRDPDSPLTPSKAEMNRPALKIVIPDAGGRVADPVAQPEKKVAAVPTSEAKKRSQVDKDPTPKQASPFTPIPRAPIPTPVIFLQPPTPPAGQATSNEREKLEFNDSPMVDISTKKPETLESTPQSGRNLALPPSPTIAEPVHLPTETPTSSTNREAENFTSKRANFTFIIPPAKGYMKRGRGRPRKHPLKETSSSSTSKSMSVDRDNGVQSQGYDLSLMFDSPSKENPHGGLPMHLQPRPLSELPSKSPKKLIGWQSNAVTAPRKTWNIGEEVIGVVPFTSDGTPDNKQSVERQVRPALIKLFGRYYKMR